MQMVMLKSLHISPDEQFEPGDPIDVDENRASYLIARHMARPVEIEIVKKTETGIRKNGRRNRKRSNV